MRGFGGAKPPRKKSLICFWLLELGRACSAVVADVVAAANETSHAEARLAKPSQASQSREGLTNGIGYVCDGRGKPRDSQLPVELDTSSL